MTLETVLIAFSMVVWSVSNVRERLFKNLPGPAKVTSIARDFRVIASKLAKHDELGEIQSKTKMTLTSTDFLFPRATHIGLIEGLVPPQPT